jgi:hypothetical protein
MRIKVKEYLGSHKVGGHGVFIFKIFVGSEEFQAKHTPKEKCTSKH